MPSTEIDLSWWSDHSSWRIPFALRTYLLAWLTNLTFRVQVDLSWFVGSDAVEVAIHRQLMNLTTMFSAR